MKVVSIFKIPNNSSFPKQTSHGFFLPKFPQNQRGKNRWIRSSTTKNTGKFSEKWFSWTPKKGEVRVRKPNEERTSWNRRFWGPLRSRNLLGCIVFISKQKERKHGSQKAKLWTWRPMVFAGFLTGEVWQQTWNSRSPLRWYPKTGVILWRSGI